MWPAFLRPAPDSIIANSRERGKSGWTEAIHLVWSVWIFLTPVFESEGFTLRWALITAVSYPLFLLLYARLMTTSRRFSNYYALVMVVMSLLLLRWYAGATTYFIYGCLMLRSCSSLWRHVGYVAALNVLYAAVALVAVHYSWQAMLWVAMLTLSFSVVIQVEIRADMQNRALRLSQEEVRRLAATAERERIGRDLHDLLGHTLSLITLKLELSRKLFDRDHESARRELADAEQVARKALAEVRAAVTGIRATDLAAELASAHLLLETSGVLMHYEPSGQRLPAEVEAVLALVLREAVTNIARHAKATRAEVDISVEASTLHLCIHDNGRGGVDAFGNGLVGMRERVEGLGGTLRIDSPRERGTTLRIEVPLPKRVANERDATAPDAAMDVLPSTLLGGHS